MRCQDVKQWLSTRHADPAQVDTALLQEHLEQCSDCRLLERTEHTVDAMLQPTSQSAPTSVPTDRIMSAIQERKRATQQLEDIHSQQQTRLAQLRPVGLPVAVLGFFLLGCVPLLVLAVILIQTDLVVKALALLGNMIDIPFVIVLSIQAWIPLALHNNWLLSGLAFVVVVMMGIWLRLMYAPHEA